MWWKKKKVYPTAEIGGLNYSFDMPPTSWIAEATEEFTSDLFKLESKTHHLMFVYDETQRKHHRHELLNNSEFKCVAFTMNVFQLWKKNLGSVSYPIPLREMPWDDTKVPDYQNTPKIRIKGELWRIPTENILILDKHKANGLHFVREKVRLLIPYRKLSYIHGDIVETQTHTVSVRAWMYVGVPFHWVNQLDGGYNFSLVRQFQSNSPLINGEPLLRNYYQYTMLEYRDF